MYDSVQVFAVGLRTLEQSHALRPANISCELEHPWDGGLSLTNYINSVSFHSSYVSLPADYAIQIACGAINSETAPIVSHDMNFTRAHFRTKFWPCSFDLNSPTSAYPEDPGYI